MIYPSSKFLFTYSLFDVLNLQRLPSEGIRLLYTVMSVSAFLVAVGFFTRLSLSVMLACFSYSFLLEKSYYNNHYYLFMLVMFLLLWMGSHHHLSLDSKIWSRLKNKPIPLWNIFVLRMQVCLVYFYGGITKLGHDWLDLHSA